MLFRMVAISATSSPVFDIVHDTVAKLVLRDSLSEVGIDQPEKLNGVSHLDTALTKSCLHAAVILVNGHALYASVLNHVRTTN